MKSCARKIEWRNVSNLPFRFLGPFCAISLTCLSLGCQSRSNSSNEGEENESKTPKLTTSTSHSSKQIAHDRAKEFLRVYLGEGANDYFDKADFPATSSFDEESGRWTIWFSNGIPGNSKGIELDRQAEKGTVMDLSGNVLSGNNGKIGPDDPMPLFTLLEFREVLRKNQIAPK